MGPIAPPAPRDAVGELGRDDERAPAALAHAGDAEVPALDDALGAEREVEGLHAVPRGVELLAVLERDADVMDGDVIAGLGGRAAADDDVVGLQLGRRLAGRRGDLGLGAEVV